MRFGAQGPLGFPNCAVWIVLHHKTKIIPLNRKHSQLYHSGGFACLAQLLIDVLLRFRFKSDRRLGLFRISIGKPAYLERVEYWQQHG